MSYYRRADGSAPPSSDEDAIDARLTSPKCTQTPFRPLVKAAVKFDLGDDIISPNATTQPLPMKAANGIRRKPPPKISTRVNASKGGVATSGTSDGSARRKASSYRWTEGECCFNQAWSMKVCYRELAPGSMNCNLHSCKAINADQTRCCNTVWNPNHGPYCLTGYHVETETYEPVEKALALRQEYNEIEQRNRMQAHLEDVKFFSKTWPTIDVISPSHSNSSVETKGSRISPRTPQSSELPAIAESMMVQSRYPSTDSMTAIWHHDYEVPPLPKSNDARSRSRDGLDSSVRLQASWPFSEEMTTQLLQQHSQRQ